jgi:uncharacterized protein YjiK
MYRITTPLLLLLSLISFHCTREENYENPPDYDLSHPQQIKLPLELDEISGLAYYAKDTSVFAINDERGWLYKIGLGASRSITRWKFSPGADFEDIVMLDSTFYILQSNGTIFRVEADANGIRQPPTEIPFQYNQENEFESLYWDDTKKKLILVCKDCEADKKRSLTTFSFDPATGQFSDASFSIKVNSIAEAAGKTKIRFKPSAATINPADSLLYIVSAINKMIVVTDRNGTFKKAYHLRPSLFKQPEGIAFAPNGTMIISNEAADVGVADILIFPRKVQP